MLAAEVRHKKSMARRSRDTEGKLNSFLFSYGRGKNVNGSKK